jgi:hypothetical protein
MAGLVSSVKMTSGSKVTLFSQAGYGGAAITLDADSPDLSPRSFDNAPNSFRRQEARRILFIGNSFTHGHAAPVLYYNAAHVTDLNGTGYGGVPGIFRELADEAGLSFDVFIEAVSSQSLRYHYTEKLGHISARKWDVVTMQDYSTLDIDSPGDPGNLLIYSGLIERYVHGTEGNNTNANAAADVFLMETWAYPDQVWNAPGPWNGKSLHMMSQDLHNAYNAAWIADPAFAGVIPVGSAAIGAVDEAIADPYPYDGISAGKVNPWYTDNKHFSSWGSYLEALIELGRIAGVDPRTFGGASKAGHDLNLTSAEITAAQEMANRQLRMACLWTLDAGCRQKRNFAPLDAQGLAAGFATTLVARAARDVSAQLVPPDIGSPAKLRIQYASAPSAAAFAEISGGTIDLSDATQGLLSVEVFPVDYGSNSSGFSFKLQSSANCATADVSLGRPPEGVWTTVTIPMTTVLRSAAACLNLRTVNAFAIYPHLEEQSGVRYALRQLSLRF